ncbi:MAG: 4Fe-4S dicluster domain-containing protein, partial [Thermomicrobiaceae bacterium]|nr:4Fe-4S dicluster domain-containing protein [Thermomicrobiaceae bacterium]
ENNVPINTEEIFHQRRAMEWIRVERYWEGEFPNVKARYIPIPCMHCENAPCEPVCPVYATYHTSEGINMQVYNRCIGTRYCAVNCHWHVRFFNFWEPKWPESLKNQLNPDVTVRSRGVMEKCTFCVHRVVAAEQRAFVEGRQLGTDEVITACAQACPTSAITFGDLNDANSRVRKLMDANSDRIYRLLEDLGTDPAVYYLMKVDPEAPESEAEHS